MGLDYTSSSWVMYSLLFNERCSLTSQIVFTSVFGKITKITAKNVNHDDIIPKTSIDDAIIFH